MMIYNINDQCYNNICYFAALHTQHQYQSTLSTNMINIRPDGEVTVHCSHSEGNHQEEQNSLIFHLTGFDWS